MTTRIAVDKPSSPVSGAAFRVSGALFGYTGAPHLLYADDPGAPGKVSGLSAQSEPKALLVKWSPPTTGTVYQALPSPSSVTRTQFYFRHPGLTPGHHTVVVTDGKTSGSIGFGVQNSVRARMHLYR